MFCLNLFFINISVVDSAAVLHSLVLALQLFLFPKMGIDGGDWRALLQYQAVTYAICIGGAAALVPLNLHMRDSPSDTVRGRMLGISGLKMLKSPILYAMAAIFLFNSLGLFPYSVGSFTACWDDCMMSCSVVWLTVTSLDA